MFLSLSILSGLPLPQLLLLCLLVGAYVLCFGTLELGRWRCSNVGRYDSLYPDSSFPLSVTDGIVLYAVMLFFFFSFALSLVSPEMGAMEVTATSLSVELVSMAVIYSPMLVRVAGASSWRRGVLAKISGVFRAWKAILCATAICLGFNMLYELSGLLEWVVNTFHCAENQQIVDLLSAGDPALCIVISVAAVIMAPICEECCYRGFLYGSVRRFVGPVMGAICSSLVFAAVHLSLAQMLPLFVFALAQCWLYEKTRTLCTTMMMHAIFNIINILGVFFFMS